MCYSAVVVNDLDRLAMMAQAQADHDMFAELYARRAAGEDIKLARALDDNFLTPKTAKQKRIATDIRTYRENQSRQWEAQLFDQKKRLADAERKFAARATKKSAEEKRIATNKIDWLLKKLSALNRPGPAPGDSRIFPFWYAPVIVEEGGKRWIRPMRYHLRAHGKPAGTDRRYPGLYNARRDNLEGYWKALFGQHHAIAVLESFYENVAQNDFENRALRMGEKPKNLVLHFNPQPRTDMFVACLWDRWREKGAPDLCSFAAITDDPPPEVAATGHNRCIIPLKPQNLGTWLHTPPSSRQPESREPDLNAYYALLDDRERPYYAHELAA